MIGERRRSLVSSDRRLVARHAAGGELRYSRRQLERGPDASESMPAVSKDGRSTRARAQGASSTKERKTSADGVASMQRWMEWPRAERRCQGGQSLEAKVTTR